MTEARRFAIVWDAAGNRPDALCLLLPVVGEAALSAEGLLGSYRVGLRLVDDAAIQVLNRETRGIDRPTDVLSFPMISYPVGKTAGVCPKRLRREYDSEIGGMYLGDIVLSLERATAQAEAYGHSYVRECCFLFAHGLLHLMGYDHIDETDRAAMRRMEENVMHEAGLPRDASRDEEMLRLAREARKHAYVPYSKYAVGACLLTEDGQLYTGCNVENAAFPSCICGERTALVKAVSEGHRRFAAIAVAAEGMAPWPCGNCRQMLYEFSPKMRVLVTWGDQVEESTLDALLPHGFGPFEM